MFIIFIENILVEEKKMVQLAGIYKTSCSNGGLKNKIFLCTTKNWSQFIVRLTGYT